MKYVFWNTYSERVALEHLFQNSNLICYANTCISLNSNIYYSALYSLTCCLDLNFNVIEP